MSADPHVFQARSGNIWRYGPCDPAAHPCGWARGWTRDGDGRIAFSLGHPEGLEGVDRDHPIARGESCAPAPLSAKTLAELRRLEAEATPGPWEWVGDGLYGHEPDDWVLYLRWVEDNRVALHRSDHDAALIAALRNAAPALLARAELAGRLARCLDATLCPDCDDGVVDEEECPHCCGEGWVLPPAGAAKLLDEARSLGLLEVIP